MPLRVLLPLAFALAGCAGLPSPPTSRPESAAAGQATLQLSRSADLPPFGLRRARVSLDGERLIGLSPGARRTLSVPSGSHVLAVDLWDVPGACELRLELAPGEQRALHVVPRRIALASSLPIAAMGDTTPAGSALAGLTMLASLGIESSGKPCGGAFALVDAPGRRDGRAP